MFNKVYWINCKARCSTWNKNVTVYGCWYGYGYGYVPNCREEWSQWLCSIRDSAMYIFWYLSTTQTATAENGKTQGVAAVAQAGCPWTCSVTCAYLRGLPVASFFVLCQRSIQRIQSGGPWMCICRQIVRWTAGLCVLCQRTARWGRAAPAMWIV